MRATSAESTRLDNKAVYRARMAIADGEEASFLFNPTLRRWIDKNRFAQ